MRVTMRGYFRDHGTWILAEDELTETWPVKKYQGCPKEGLSLEYTEDNNIVSSLNFKKHVRANMNGDYILEVTLSATDVVFLCWFAFRKRALSVLLRLFGEHEKFEKDAEEQHAKVRNFRINRRL